MVQPPTECEVIPASASTTEPLTFPTIEFEVVKQHHQRSWLKQKRLLILTDTSISNAKPRSKPTDKPEVTKTHPLRLMQLIALKSKRSFLLRFQGDHDYFYSSSQALEIVWEVNRRRGAMRAVEKLTCEGASADDRKHLVSLFAGGVLDVPHSERAESEAVEKRMDLIRAIRAFAIDGAKECYQLKDRYLSYNHDEIVLHVFREELTERRDVLTHQLVTRQRSFTAALNAKFKGREIPIFEDDMEACVCAEEAIQALIAEPVYPMLWEVLLFDEAVKEQQRRFEGNRRALALQNPSGFGLREEFANCNFRLAHDYLDSLQRTRNPANMMNIFSMIAKSILLTLNASSEHCSPERGTNVGDEQRLAAAKASLSVSADDMLPLFVFVLTRSHSDDHYIPFFIIRNWIETIGDPNECTERAYYFTMFSSAVEYILVSNDEAVPATEMSSPPELPVSVQNFEAVVPSQLPPASPAVSCQSVFTETATGSPTSISAADKESSPQPEVNSDDLYC